MTSITRSELLAYLDRLLKPSRHKDYCPNGLQVEGVERIDKLVTGVTASQALIDAAVQAGADAILVHHGFFWRGEPEPIVGIKRRRIATLLENNISLIAYHLPLDVHVEVGNNVQLAVQLGWQPDAINPKDPVPLVRTAQFEQPLSGAAVAELLAERLARVPQHIAADRDIAKIAWCTGAAQSYFEEAIALGADAFVSGEISEPTYHLAREYDVHYFAAGHHATERYGVAALGQRLADEFQLAVEFIDCPNPV